MPDLSIENVTRVKWEIYGYRKHFIPNSFFSLPVGGQFCLDGHPDIKLCLKFYHRDSKAQFIFVLDEIGTHKQITLSFDSWIENSYNNSVSVQSATSHFTSTGKTFTLEFEALKPGSQFSYNPKYDHESTFWHILNYRKNSSVMSSNSLVNTYNGLVAAKNTTFDLDMTFFCEIKLIVPKKPIFASYQNDSALLRWKLWKAHEQNQETQVATMVDDKEFKVSRDLLTCQSEVFATMLSSPNYKEACSGQIKIEDFDASTIEHFVKWIYLEEIENTELLEDLFELGHKYSINELMNQAAEMMHFQLNNGNVIQYLVCALRYKLDDLAAKIVEFLRIETSNNRMKLFQAEVWQRFSLSDRETATKFMNKLCI